MKMYIALAGFILVSLFAFVDCSTKVQLINVNKKF